MPTVLLEWVTPVCPLGFGWFSLLYWMIVFSGPAITAQFKRAVKIATGHDLSDNVLDTVFKLFDMDGDNCLSHKEFIGVMKDRVLRGLKASLSSATLSLVFKAVNMTTKYVRTLT